MSDHFQPPRETADHVPDRGERVEFFRRNEFREAVWKLASLLLLMQAATTGAYMLLDANGGQRVLLAILAFALASGSGLSFLRSRKYLVMPDDERLVDRPAILNLQVVLLSLIGVYLLVTALPALVGALVLAHESRRLDESLPIDWALCWHQGIATLFGLVLFLTPESIQAVWLRFRRYGR
jgi:hypothetical protein